MAKEAKTSAIHTVGSVEPLVGKRGEFCFIALGG